MKKIQHWYLGLLMMAFAAIGTTHAQAPFDCYASFSYYSDPSAPETVQFFDASWTSGTVAQLTWDFGDGTVETGAMPVHTYAQTGTYNVTLTIETNEGCVNSTTYTLYVFNYNCYPSFYAYSTDFNDQLTVTFFDYSASSSPITSYLWDFGDGNTSTEAQPVHTYEVGGIYNASLTFTSEDCGEVMSTQQIYVNNGWGACATGFYYYQNSISDYTMYFVGSQYTGGDIVSWVWDFGDGTTSTGQTATHLFQSAGTFNVTLTTTTADGCTNTTTTEVYALDPNACNVSFYYGFGLGGNYQFYNYSYVPGNNVTYTWNFGDGTIVTNAEQNVEHEYETAGQYSVTLTATSDVCSGTYTYDVWVDEYYLLDCYASYSYYQANPADWTQVTFIDYSYTSSGVTSWLWNFGDGTTSTEAAPTHDYADYGSYDVTLTITTGDCESTVTYSVYVQENIWFDPCYTSFYYYQDYSDSTTVNFYADNYFWWFWFDSTYTNNYTFTWDFGDGTTGTGQNPVHTYPMTGTYSVTLNMTNAETGCNETITYDVVVSNNTGWWFSGCYASFWFAQEGTSPMTINFYDASYSNSALTYLWDFGDGNTSTDQNPMHTYDDDGIYNVSLTITGDDGCTNTVSSDIWVGDNVWYPDGCQAFFNADISGQVVNFMDFSTSTDNIVSWAWDFGDGQVSTESNPTHEYSIPEVYTVYLTITTDDNCSSTFQLNVDLLNGFVGGGNSFNFLVATATEKPQAEALDVRLAPNPTTDVVNMTFVAGTAFTYEATVTDVNGSRISSERLQAKKGENNRSFDVSTLPAGIYVLSLRTDNAVQSLRFVKL